MRCNMMSSVSTIRKEGFKALNKELGVMGTAIVIRQFEIGYANCTEEREELINHLTIDDIVASIDARKKDA